MLEDQKLDEMTLEELDAYIASFPKEIQDKADEIMRTLGIALGKARAEYFEKLMREE